MIKYTISHITEKEVAEKVGIFSKLFKDNTDMLASPAAGRTIDISEVADPTFAEGILGQGIAIIPSDDTVYSPCDGTIDLMFDTGHAVNLISDKGTEIHIHIGLETVSLKGKHFKTFMNTGDKVKKGDTVGWINRGLSFGEITETPVRCEVTLRASHPGIRYPLTADVTLRRRQSFRPAPGSLIRVSVNGKTTRMTVPSGPLTIPGIVFPDAKPVKLILEK